MNKETENKELEVILEDKEIEKVLKGTCPEKKALLGLLLEDIINEAELYDKINEIGSPIRNPKRENMDLCAQYEKELKQAKRYLKRDFQKAVELGLGDMKYIRENYKKYVGEELTN